MKELAEKLSEKWLKESDNNYPFVLGKMYMSYAIILQKLAGLHNFSTREHILEYVDEIINEIKEEIEN